MKWKLSRYLQFYRSKFLNHMSTDALVIKHVVMARYHMAHGFLMNFSCGYRTEESFTLHNHDDVLFKICFIFRNHRTCLPLELSWCSSIFFWAAPLLSRPFLNLWSESILLDRFSSDTIFLWDDSLLGLSSSGSILFLVNLVLDRPFRYDLNTSEI